MKFVELLRLFTSRMVLAPVVVFIPYVIIRAIILLRSHRRFSLKHELLLTIYVLYLVSLASVVFFPDRKEMFGDNGEYLILPVYSTIPGHMTFGILEEFGFWSREFLINIFGNIIVFIPVGFLTPLVQKRARNVKNALCFAVVFPLCIEFVQAFIGRTADIDDVVLNFSGLMLGWLIYAIILKRKGRGPHG